MPFIVTLEHEAIFSHVRAAKENLIIEAVAGAGKSSTVCQSMSCLPVRDSLCAPSVACITFSRPAADMLQTKLPKHIQSITFNALGHRALGRMFPESRRRRDWLDARKCAKILWDLGEKENPDFQNILRLVGLLKSVPVAPQGSIGEPRPLGSIAALAQGFLSQHDLVFDEEREAIGLAQAVLQKSNSLVERSIDFNDQLYLPVLLNAAFDEQDFVFVDECQDTNEIQLEILERLGRVGTFFCFVGDPWQAIYGFRGANTDSMDRIRSRFSCKTLPLSVSYRCPKAIVREAQKYMKD